MKTNRGFTLIELLVVIAVIGILAAVVVASVKKAQVTSRNTKRSQDISQMIKAFNIAVTGGASLTNTIQGWHCISATCYGQQSHYTTNGHLDSILLANMSSKPIDPPGGERPYGGYIYSYSSSPGYDNGALKHSVGLLRWAAEVPLRSDTCAPGIVFVDRGSYVDCLAYILP